MALALSGCVVSGPPDYKDPAKTPPLLDLGGADPLVFTLVSASTGKGGTTLPTTQIFTVPVRSEDAGDRLVGLLYLDYKTPNEVRQSSVWTGPASTFDDTTRMVTLPWSAANQPQGCHTLTMEVTHESNVDFSTGVPVVSPKPLDDVAFATWWVDIDEPDNPSTTNPANPVSGCPKKSP